MAKLILKSPYIKSRGGASGYLCYIATRERVEIPPDNFRWYAAFHDENEHPHVHMMAWSDKPGQGYLSKDGIRQMKSNLTNHIFRHEMLHLYEQKAQSRDELVYESRRAMLELTREMQNTFCEHPEAERLLWELSQQLEIVKGKKSYGYLTKRQKALVDQIVDQMERLPVVHNCYKRWLELQNEGNSYYHDQPYAYVPLSRQKEFRQIKNAVIRQAENLRLGKMTFEDRGIREVDEPDTFRYASYEYRSLVGVIQDEEQKLDDRLDAVKDMKRLADDGDCYAQYILGKLYLMGQEVPQNRELGIYWLTQSAQQGNPYAELFLQRADRQNTLALLLSVTQLLYDMSQIFRNNSIPHSHPKGIHIDKKRLMKLIEKRQAMGIKDMRFDSLTM